jgi:hypothetical protein
MKGCRLFRHTPPIRFVIREHPSYRWRFEIMVFDSAIFRFWVHVLGCDVLGNTKPPASKVEEATSVAIV